MGNSIFLTIAWKPGDKIIQRLIDREGTDHPPHDTGNQLCNEWL
jgi:hypothetical protein